MAKQVKQYIKNPKYGQPGESERILVPQMISENGAFLNRMAQIEKLEYNATQVTGNNYNGLAEALASVTNDKYKVKGIVLTWFDSAENQWKSMRYNGTDSTGWSEVGNWVETGGGSGNTNYYQISAEILSLTEHSTSEEIQTAFGGDSGFLSVVKAVEEGAFLYVGMNQNSNYAYMTIPYCLWRKAEVETDGVLGFSYDVPTEGTIMMEISKTGSNYEISITVSSSSSVSSEHTLDLSPLFDEEGSPVATVSDEFLAELQKAYDEKYSNVIFMGVVIPMSISYDKNIYSIDLILTADLQDSKWSLAAYRFNINDNDKSLSFGFSALQAEINGSGTKALTDNGKYAEFVPEAPADGKTYSRNNKQWVETSGGTQYLDLSIFSEASGTLSDEDFQKVVKAYEDKINVGLYEDVSVILTIVNSGTGYVLMFSSIEPSITVKTKYIVIQETKAYQITSNEINIDLLGSGTKALTDNGQYAEFAKPSDLADKADKVKVENGGTGAVTKELQPNTFYKFEDCSSLTITLAAKKPDIFNEYMFEFKCGESPTTLSLPESIEWDRGDILSTKALNKYIISIIENIATYKEVVWYKKVESIQVNNTSDTYYVRINGVDINKTDSFLYRIGDNITLFAWNSGRVSITLRYKDGTTANKSTSNNMQNVITIEKEINQVIINY